MISSADAGVIAPRGSARFTPFDGAGAFQAVAEEGSLRRLAVRGAGVSTFSKAAVTAIQFVSAVLLARLLAPVDFGRVAAVTTFSLLLMSFGLNGVTEAIIQSKELDRFVGSNLFWINVIAGFMLTIGFAGSGSLLAWFYRDPVVSRITIAVSPTIILANFGYVHLALMKRAMRFAAVSFIDMSSRAISTAISILLAWTGWGYWALVAGLVAQALCMTLGAWALCRWVPGLPRRRNGTGPLVDFAVPVYTRFGIRYALRNMDNLLVGWRFNAVALGFYKKAYDLFALSADQLVTPLSDVALATLSRLRHDPAQYKKYLVNSLSIIAFVGMAVGADLTLVGRDLIRLVLGPKWLESGQIFTLFGPGIGVMLLHSCSGWIHLSIGKPGRWLRWSLIELVVTGLLFLLALRWGPAGVAGAWSASYYILTIPALWYAGRPIELRCAPLLGAVWKHAVASLLAACASAAIAHRALSLTAASAATALEGIVVISAVFVTLYLTAVILLHRGCAPLYLFAGLLREMLPARTPPSVVAAVRRFGHVRSPRSPSEGSRANGTPCCPDAARAGPDPATAIEARR